MAVLKSWRFGIGFLLTLCVVGVVYFGYFYCAGANCALRGNSSPLFKSNYEAYLAGRYLQNKFPQNELNKDFSIDLDNQDVIVFLHIQKTGGSVFGKHLVENLEVDPPCHCYKRVKKRCDCLNKRKQVWLFSRFSTGWRCGLHADWTELTSCVSGWFERTYGKKNRNYHYITILRDPVRRFISEWMHVRRGATWKAATLKCNGREATLQEVPFCYDSKDWTGVTLQEFLDCPHNLAFNRQTRMLANLNTVHCYDTSAYTPARRNALLLASAKRNLRHMAYFGLVEFQTYSQLLFQHTLDMSFLHDFVQHNVTHSSQGNLTAQDMTRIAELNQLDIELYQFAKDLFLQRVRQMYVEEGLPVPERLENLIGQEAAAGQTMEIVDEDDSESPEEVLGRPIDSMPKEKLSTQLKNGDSMRKDKAGDSSGNTLSRKQMFGKQNNRLSTQLVEGGREDRLGEQQGPIDDERRFRSSDSQHIQTSHTQHQQDRLSSLIKEKLLQSRSRR